MNPKHKEFAYNHTVIVNFEIPRSTIVGGKGRARDPAFGRGFLFFEIFFSGIIIFLMCEMNEISKESSNGQI